MLKLVILALIVLLGSTVGIAVLAVIAFVSARRVRRLEASLQALSARLTAFEATSPEAGSLAPKSSPDTASPESDAENARNQETPPQQPEAPSPARPPSTPPPYIPATVPPVQATTSTVVPEPPVPEPGLEERLGTRWAVYIGGAAIALGGIFLVRHAIEAGWLGPAMRIVLGLLLGAGLVAAGSLTRAGDTNIRVARLDGAHIPSVLTAAGTAILFATVYAAHALYGFIGPGMTFLVLGAIGLGTMLSAARHGPALAGLGLAGSYATPVLVQSSTPNPWALVIYLTVVTAAAMAMARLRGWLWLAYTAVGGGVLWAAIMAVDSEWKLALAVHILIQAAIAAFAIAIEPTIDRKEDNAEPDIPATIAFAALSAVAILTLAAMPYDDAVLPAFGIAMMGLLAGTAYVAPAAAALATYALIVLAAALYNWPGLDLPPTGRDFYGAPPNLISLPDYITSFLGYAALTAAGLTAIATWTLRQRPRLPLRTTGLFAIAATMPPLVALTISYLRITQFGTALSFSLIGAALAVGFALLAEDFFKREGNGKSTIAKIPTGAFATAAIAALAIALTAGLQRGYLTVAFALAALGAAYVSNRRDIPILRYAVTALGVVVLARMMWDPYVMGTDLGTTPFFNWLLVGYGIPAVAFWLCARFLKQRRDDLASHISDALALLFTTLFGIFEIRHFVHGGAPLAPTSTHLEMGLMAVLFLGLSYALDRITRNRRSPVLEVGQVIATLVAVLITAFGLIIAHNPAFTNEPVSGGVPLSTLLPAYLLPGLMALYIARNASASHESWYVRVVAVTALVLIFTYVTLEVRHAFHGARMGLLYGVTQAEMWAYTAAWLALAVIYLAYGLIRGSLPARAASGALLCITIVKVALFDLAGVTGVWRALSFLCLGAVLIGIGLIYQKLVFAHGDSDSTKPPPEEQPAG